MPQLNPWPLAASSFLRTPDECVSFFVEGDSVEGISGKPRFGSVRRVGHGVSAEVGAAGSGGQPGPWGPGLEVGEGGSGVFRGSPSKPVVSFWFPFGFRLVSFQKLKTIHFVAADVEDTAMRVSELLAKQATATTTQGHFWQLGRI